MFYLSFPVVSLWADGLERRKCLREMLARNIFGAKKRSPARELAWEAIVNSLNEIYSPKFQLKDKKAVRERWSLVRKKVLHERRREGKWDFCRRVINGKIDNWKYSSRS